MKPTYSPELKAVTKPLGTGEASQGEVTFNHRNYTGVQDNGKLSRLAGGFGPFLRGGKVLNSGSK
jgi:hypothetical protein